MMKLKYSVIALSLALAGCGGSDGSATADTSAPTYSISGRVAVESSIPATVCVDLDNSAACESDEPKVKTDETGVFTITDARRDILTKLVIANVPVSSVVQSSQVSRMAETATQHTVLMAPAAKAGETTVINGVSTLLAALNVNGQSADNADAQIKQLLANSGVILEGSVSDALESEQLTVLNDNVIALAQNLETNYRVPVLVALANKIDALDGQNLALTEVDSQQLHTAMTTLKANLHAVVKLNDTGKTQFFTDGDTSQDVNEPVASFPNQDADFGFDVTNQQARSGNGFKFIKLDEQGQRLADDAESWSCILDERSGLVWENKLNDQSVRDVNQQFVYETETFKPYIKDIEVLGCEEGAICSTLDYAKHINEMTLCGLTDWRVPTQMEAFNLIDFGETEKNANDLVYGLSVKYFPNQTNGGTYTETGESWTQSINFSQFDANAYQGAKYFTITAMLGPDRGYSASYEINSSATPNDDDHTDSHQFPVRLVAKSQ